ncbi:MAG: tetratricopeptide repeat protein [Betaproteobacteria bacterium]|nr:tetratricopeptide repeat protein [Betaproteobacteria bacterium]
MALALPSPKDIETEIQAGNFAKAESMLREVIAEKPQSAKAHYELGQVLARQEREPVA